MRVEIAGLTDVNVHELRFVPHHTEAADDVAKDVTNQVANQVANEVASRTEAGAQ